MKTKLSYIHTAVLLLSLSFLMTYCTEEEVEDFKNPVQGYWWDGKKYTFEKATYQLVDGEGQLKFFTNDPMMYGSVVLTYKSNGETDLRNLLNTPVGRFSFRDISLPIYIDKGYLFFSVIASPQITGASIVDIKQLNDSIYKVKFSLQIEEYGDTKLYDMKGSYEGSIENLNKLTY